VTDLNRVSVVTGYGGGDAADPNQPYLPQGTNAVTFVGDSFFTNGVYDEGSAEVVLGDLGAKTVGAATGFSHGFGMTGGTAVCVNSTYVYYTGTQGSENGSLTSGGQGTYPGVVGGGQFYRWTGITRLLKSDGSLAAGFSGATGYQFHFCEVDQDVVDGTGAVIGQDKTCQGVCASATEVFIAAWNRIEVRDQGTMAVLRTLSVSGAGQLALAADGHVWATVGGNVLKINKTSGATITTVTPAHPPGMIGVCSDDGSLWVADNVTFQVRVYAPDGSGSPTSYGTAGGIVGNGGVVTTGTLFGTIIGFDRNGTTYRVAYRPSKGTILRKFTSTTTLSKEMIARIFVEVPGWESDTSIRTPAHRSAVDMTQPVGSQVTFAAVTIDETNPAEFRIKLGISQCYQKTVSGHKYVFGMSQRGDAYTIHEVMVGTEILRPCGAFCMNPGPALGADGRLGGLAHWKPATDGSTAPNQAEWSYVPSIWATQPVGFMSMADDGSLTFTLPKSGDPAYLWRVPLSSIDGHGNPVYDLTAAAANAEGFPGGSTQGVYGTSRYYYDSANDHLLEFACPPLRPPPGYATAGTAMRRWGNWSNPTTRYVVWEQSLASDRGQDQPYAVGVDFRTVAGINGVIAVGHLLSSEVHLYRYDSGAYLHRAVSFGVTGVNLTETDSYFGVQPRILASGKIAYTQEREIGNSFLLAQCTPVPASTATVLDVVAWAARTRVENLRASLIDSATDAARMSVAWDPQYGGAAVNVYRSNTSGSGYALAPGGGNLSGTTLAQNGLAAGANYYLTGRVLWQGQEGPAGPELHVLTEFPVLYQSDYTGVPDHTAFNGYNPVVGPAFDAHPFGGTWEFIGGRIAQTAVFNNADYLRLPLVTPGRHFLIPVKVVTDNTGSFSSQHLIRFQDLNNHVLVEVGRAPSAFGGNVYLGVQRRVAGVYSVVGGGYQDIGNRTPGTFVNLEIFDAVDDLLQVWADGVRRINPFTDHSYSGYPLFWLGNYTDGNYAPAAWGNVQIWG